MPEHELPGPPQDTPEPPRPPDYSIFFSTTLRVFHCLCETYRQDGAPVRFFRISQEMSAYPHFYVSNYAIHKELDQLVSERFVAETRPSGVRLYAPLITLDQLRERLSALMQRALRPSTNRPQS